jgi:hypothetical protein
MAANRSHSMPAGLLAVAGAALWLATTACSQATATPTSMATTTTGALSATSGTTVGIAGYVAIDGRRVAIPDEGTRPIDPVEDVGEQIIITPKAIEPHRLFCQVKRQLTFTNLTTVPQQLRFVNDGNWRSPTIAPGATWHYTPTFGISFYYKTMTGLQATFQASAPISGNP